MAKTHWDAFLVTPKILMKDWISIFFHAAISRLDEAFIEMSKTLTLEIGQRQPLNSADKSCHYGVCLGQAVVECDQFSIALREVEQPSGDARVRRKTLYVVETPCTPPPAPPPTAGIVSDKACIVQLALANIDAAVAAQFGRLLEQLIFNRITRDVYDVEHGRLLAAHGQSRTHDDRKNKAL